MIIRASLLRSNLRRRQPTRTLSRAVATRSDFHYEEPQRMPVAPFDPALRRVELPPRAQHLLAEYSLDPPPPEQQGRQPLSIFALHGCPGSTWDWRWLGPALRDALHAPVYRIGVPGHGGTERAVTAGPRFDAMADSSWMLIDSILKQHAQPGASKLLLVGHSMGCDLAIHAAARHPERIAGLILINAPGVRAPKILRPESAIRFISQTLHHPLAGPLMKRFLWRFYIHALGFPQRVTRDEVEWSQHRAAARNFGQLEADAEALRAGGVPALVAYSDDDPLVEPAIAEELADRLAARTVLRFSHGGHYVQKHQALTLAEHAARVWGARDL